MERAWKSSMVGNWSIRGEISAAVASNISAVVDRVFGSHNQTLLLRNKITELKSRKTLTHILNTHHHGDHVGGNAELKTEGVQVLGPAADGKIPCMDVPLKEGDTLSFAGANAVTMDVGGHTTGHIAFYFPEEKTAFVGDSLFSLGCGKMFEGTPEQYWLTLQRLRNLPDDTTIYCAHEYTEGNARFAMSVEPNNPDLVRRVEEINDKRSRGEPTVPSLMGEEKRTNPFLRGDVSPEIRKNVGATEDEDGAAIFHKIRLGKDNFRG